MQPFGRIDNADAIAENVTDEPFENGMSIDLFGSFRAARAAAKKAMIPEARCGNEGEIDTAAPFLASPNSSYVIGAILPMDGERALQKSQSASRVEEHRKANRSIPQKGSRRGRLLCGGS